jgi:aurora kinase
LRDFVIEQQLGKGGFGIVYLAHIKLKPRYTIALKSIPKFEAVRLGKQIRREIEIQRNVHHPNILPLYGFFHDESHIYLMLEFATVGQLDEQLSRYGSFSEEMSSSYVQQITEALSYLHLKGIIHRDIKPENLLLGQRGELKVGDFGLSVHSRGNR